MYSSAIFMLIFIIIILRSETPLSFQMFARVVSCVFVVFVVIVMCLRVSDGVFAVL